MPVDCDWLTLKLVHWISLKFVIFFAKVAHHNICFVKCSVYYLLGFHRNLSVNNGWPSSSHLFIWSVWPDFICACYGTAALIRVLIEADYGWVELPPEQTCSPDCYIFWNDCAPSEDSDQPGHPPSLIRVFAVRMKKCRGCPGWSESSLGSQSFCWFLLVLSWGGSFCKWITPMIQRIRTYWNSTDMTVAAHTNEPPRDKTNKMACPPSLIRVFAVRMKKAWVLSYPLSAQRRPSDQTGWMLTLIWVFAGRTWQYVGFVTRRLKWTCQRLKWYFWRYLIDCKYSPYIFINIKWVSQNSITISYYVW